MQDSNYRWIQYPTNMPKAERERYDGVADILLAAAISDEPIAVVWAAPEEDWTDDNGVDPPRNCLLVTEHIPTSEEEWTFGKNLASIILH